LKIEIELNRNIKNLFSFTKRQSITITLNISFNFRYMSDLRSITCNFKLDNMLYTLCIILWNWQIGYKICKCSLECAIPLNYWTDYKCMYICSYLSVCDIIPRPMSIFPQNSTQLTKCKTLLLWFLKYVTMVTKLSKIICSTDIKTL